MILGRVALILGIPVVRVGLGDALTLPGVLAATAAAVAVAAATTVVIWRVGG